MSTPTVNPTRQQLDELDALLQRMLALPVNAPEAEPAPAPAPPPPMAPPNGTSYAYVTPPPAPRPMPPLPPRTAPPARPVPPPRRKHEVAPGDQTWNVPLPAGTGPGVAMFGSWPMGIEALSSARVVAPPPAAPTPPPGGNLRVTTIPSPDEVNRARVAPVPAQRLRVETPPMSVPAPPVSAQAVYNPTVMADGPPVPASLWPAAALDWVLGKMLAQLGAPGRWLGQGGGKQLIGWCGVLLVCGAIAWGVMDYMGWRW